MTASPHRYRETRALAHGGMATLSLAARDDGEDVVIKRIRPPFDHDPVYRGLFHDEGEVCARLGASEHIVRLLDRGEDELGPYLVFEHVDGTDLGIVLDACFREGRGLDLAAFFAVALPLCDALASAHEAVGDDGAPLGLVHRDVSPGNVLLSKAGEVKLADFGVAFSRLKTEHTVAGELKGKFAYMAPEQTRADAVDARADVFAAGIVLFEMLAGRRLFDGPTDADVVHAVREQEAPSLTEISPEVSPALAALVGRMLAKDPAARPSSMREVHEALAEEAAALCLDRGHKGHVARLAHAHPRPALEEHPHVVELRRRTQRVLQKGPAVVVRPARSRKPLVLASVAVAVAALGTVAFGLRGETSTASPARAEEPASPASGAQALAAGTADAVVTTPDAPREQARETALAAEDARASESADTSDASRMAASSTTKPSENVAVPKASEPSRASAPKRETTREAPRDADETRRKPPVRTPPAAKGFGTLVLESEPWANVAIDGQPLGQHTPLLGLRLPAGKHVITLENPVYRLERTVEVEIRPHAETRRFVDLTQR